ncbi:TraR/DksA C4-type zinc finger protein [Mannheimia haemolytica]
MSDQIDRANELAEKPERRHLQKFCKIRPLAPAFLSVRDCGEPIPEKRREMVIGCTRCIECQTIYEHKQKGYRR